MGFWGSVETVAVDGVAGVAGIAEAMGVPGAGLVAAGVHGLDAAGHGIAGLYDEVTGDDEGASKQFDTAADQGMDALVAGAATLMPGNPIAEGVSLGGAVTDLMHTGGVLAGGSTEEGTAMPTAGEAINQLLGITGN